MTRLPAAIARPARDPANPPHAKPTKERRTLAAAAGTAAPLAINPKNQPGVNKKNNYP